MCACARVGEFEEYARELGGAAESAIVHHAHAARGRPGPQVQGARAAIRRLRQRRLRNEASVLHDSRWSWEERVETGVWRGRQRVFSKVTDDAKSLELHSVRIGDWKRTERYKSKSSQAIPEPALEPTLVTFRPKRVRIGDLFRRVFRVGETESTRRLTMERACWRAT